MATAEVEAPATEHRRERANKDPRAVCLAIAQTVEHEWSELDAHLKRWPVVDGDPVEFQEAPLAQEIGAALIGRIEKLQFLEEFTIGYVYRNRDWLKAGKTVLGQMKKMSGLVQFYSDHHFDVQINWGMWTQMTPWQKVALVYHELRHADVNKEDKPAIQGHDIECFFDELEIFGTDTYKDWAQLAKSALSGVDVHVQYHMDLDR